MSQELAPVSVSRRIAAPAATIFAILSEPRAHVALDGSGMVRAAVGDAAITGLGDVFVMQMHFAALGDYEMRNHVVEHVPDRRIGWEPAPGHGHPGADVPSAGDGSSADDGRWGHRWIFDLVPDGPDATIVTEIYDCSRAPAAARASVDDGRIWIASMTATLERLDAVCTSR